MVVRKEKKIAAEPLRVQNPHAGGIDVHAQVHWVAAPPASAPAPPKDHPANLPPWVPAFGACTADLEMLADWLAECGVTTVAMEATGVWIALQAIHQLAGPVSAASGIGRQDQKPAYPPRTEPCRPRLPAGRPGLPSRQERPGRFLSPHPGALWRP